MGTPDVDNVVKTIASDTNTPVAIVSMMYEQTWAEFSEGARIKDYLTLLVARRVREKLRSDPDH